MPLSVVNSGGRSPAMSVQSAPETYTCSHCNEEYNDVEKVEGSFCSHQCYYRNKGQKALSQIESDHRWCATCFREVKTTWKPSKKLVIGPADHEQDVHYKDVLIGYQHPTENMVWATDDTGEGAERREYQRWGCRCGNIDLSSRDEILEAVEIDQLVARLYWCLDSFASKDALDASPDKDELFDALREEWRDWEYAIGRALYSDE